jgi:hypothetical protein
MIPKPWVATYRRMLAAIDKRIAESEPIANRPLGDREQRTARIELAFLYQARQKVMGHLKVQEWRKAATHI